MTKFVRVLGVCIIAIAVGLFSVKIWQTASASNMPVASAVKKAVSKPAYTVDNQALDGIQPLIANNSDMDISVSMTDLQTGKTYHYGDTASFTAASVGKLVTAATFLNNVEKGTEELDEPVGGTTAQDEIEKMLVDSDNTAWDNMTSDVTLAAQQTYAESIGMTSYQTNGNTVSSNDIAMMLAKLSEGKLFNNAHTQLVLGYLQQANYRDYIVAAIPDGVTVYHKVGFLEDRLHDAAIIKKGDRSYVLVIFTKSSTDSYDFTRGTALFGDITKISLKAFLGISNGVATAAQ